MYCTSTSRHLHAFPSIVQVPMQRTHDLHPFLIPLPCVSMVTYIYIVLPVLKCVCFSCIGLNYFSLKYGSKVVIIINYYYCHYLSA